MSDAAVSDDSDLRNIVHTGTPCAPLRWPSPRRPASGRTYLPPSCWDSRRPGASTPRCRAACNEGFTAASSAIFAATAAAGRLMKLSDAQMAQAIALSAPS